ncbi:FGGY family carbohydrate kinase [Cellulomonas palmilytica]|uniref:FGGY family carbohydrate kinase n=1 Tax=Cellulomonas palmilytica TaxID=2608402 RepID=UPI001EFF51AE|nr:FGGY family carbohydrate kinase [Cellulomonas palmilytica]UJP40250.1 carbohydrate kinase [Cellulomonas palmilytica]
MGTALGIDVGTTHTKVALVDVSAARTLAVASATTPAPADLLRVVAGLTRRVLDAVPGAPVPGAVGVASMAETGVPVGPDDEPRGDWLRWDGHRAGLQADELAARLGRAELFAATGVRSSAKVPLATWAWLRDEHGSRGIPTSGAVGGPVTGPSGPLHRDGRWAGAADLVVLGLTGRLVTDHTLAGRTMAYRLGAPGALPSTFDADLLAEVGLTPRHVPRVLHPGETVPLRSGPLTDAGLLVGTPVTVAGHDHAVGAFAAGVRSPGDVADSVGTSEVVCTVLAADPEPGPVAAAGMSLVRTVRGDAPALVAGSSSAGGAVAAWLAHVTDSLHEASPDDAQPGRARHASGDADELRHRLLQAASVVDDELVGLVAAAGEDDEPFVVLPYVHGRQTPAPDATATLRAVGRVPDDPVAAVRGLLLGAVLHARWMLDAQAALAGAAPTRVRALGRPVAANPAWAALKRWCTPVPLDVVADEEAVAAGAALLAAERAALAVPAPVLPALTPADGAAPPARALVDRRLSSFIAAATAP